MPTNLRKHAKDLVAEAMTAVENLDPDQVAAELTSGSAVLVDIRDAEEREKHGSIPGAIHASRGLLEFKADPAHPYHIAELNPHRRVILHCASGGRSALAAQTLSAMGYEDVAHLAGGINAWRDAGMKIQT